MKILFSTICLDAMPFLPLIWAELRKLPKEIDWLWWCMEGTALPTHCTKWCAKTEPRLSKDGTTEYLYSLQSFDERVKHTFMNAWNGKISMVNHPLVNIHNYGYDEEFLLWQMDSDELFSVEQILTCWQMFQNYTEKNAAYFWCRYYVGPDKVITTRNCFGNQSAFEWLRVWKIKPGMLFKTHEPPVIEGLKLNPFSHAETEARGLVFDHFAYATRAQVEFKEKYYAGPNNQNARHYKGLTERWERFQNSKTWPCPLQTMMPWAEPRVMVDKI